MHDWLKKNQKKLLAVMGAFLMVSFLITVPVGSLTSGGRGRGAPVAHLGKTPVYADERTRADKQWRMLEQSYLEDRLDQVLGGMFRGDRGQMMRNMVANNPQLLMRFLDQAESQGREVMALDLLGPTIQTQMKDHPDLFFLLIKEAEARGIRISDDTAATAAKNEILPIALSSGNDDAYREAVRSLLMVQALRDEVANNAKFSDPQWKQLYAERFRGVRLNIVEFTLDQFKPYAAAPTTQQINAMYAEDRNAPQDSNKSLGDSLSFGYQVPNRVKLQYFKIPRDRVVEAAKAAHRDSRDKPGAVPFDLELKARVQYDNNLSKYVREVPATEPTTAPTTRPVLGPIDIGATTKPTTGPTTLAATQPAVAAKPPEKPKATTRPFSEVEGEIVDEIIKPEADKLGTDVAIALRQRLSDDYFAFRRANPTTLPTTLPTSLPSAVSAITSAISSTTKPFAYDSFGYLEQVAADIQRQFAVLPEVSQMPDWSDAKELAALPGIGGSHTQNSDPFAQYAAERAAPFADKLEQMSVGLQLWQPSEQLTDSAQNSYIFRLTDASPAHAPPLADILPRVEEDARLKNAYTAATDAAKKFITAAKRDNFSRAALDDHRSPITTEAFNISEMEREGQLKNFQIGREATAELARKASDLLSQATPADPKPIALLSLPALRKVLVVQLDSVLMLSPEENRYRERLTLTEREEAGAGEMLAGPYFDYAAVSARMDYKRNEDQPKSGS